MRILVTGGAGFIGSHLIDNLMAKGHDVACLDNLYLGRIKNIEHHFKNRRFKFYKLDMLNFSKLNTLIKKGRFETVFHLVANSDIKKSFLDTQLDLHLNFTSTYNILEAMRNNDVKNIVFASTSAIFGEIKKAITEDTGPLIPISFYGAGKLAAEAYISAYAHNFNMKAWVIRFPNVVGERATHGILYDLMQRLKKDRKTLIVLGDGTQEKEYIYVKELVEGLIFIWRNARVNYNYFNIGSNSTIKVSRIVEILVEELGMEERIRIKYTGGDRGWVGDVPRFRYRLSKVHRLGWRPRLDSAEAVKIAVRNLRVELGL